MLVALKFISCIGNRFGRDKYSGAERCRWTNREGESGWLVLVLVALKFVKFISFIGKNNVVLDDNDNRYSLF